MADRILVAHPEPAERSRLAAVATTAGFTVIEAASGDEAVARGGGVALALVAIGLPVFDGLATALRLRQRTEGDGMPVILINDAFPVVDPRERLLKDFGVALVLPAPPSEVQVAAALARVERLPRRPRRDPPAGTDLADTPLLLLLARARRKLESGLVYVRRGGDALFVTLHQGDVVQVRANRTGAADEGQLLSDAFLWRDGEAFSYPDPAIEPTATARFDLLPLLERTSAAPLPAALAEAAERSLARASRVVFQPAEAKDDLADALGLTHFEREVLTLVDGERSVARIAALAEAGGLPLARLLLRLEALGLIVRRRPGSRTASAPARPLERASRLLPATVAAPAESAGWLEAGDLARLLVRLETQRLTGVLAVKRDGRTVEMAFAEGRIIGAHAWGGARAQDDPMQLAAVSELRPEDVPALRRLHAQRLVLDALGAPGCEWTLRRGEAYRMAETLGANPASMVAELVRAGVIESTAASPPPGDQIDEVVAALALTATEARGLRRYATAGETPAPAWLAGIGKLIDPALAIGRSGPSPDRALPAAPAEAEPPTAATDLDQLFARALDEGLREGARAGARRATEGPVEPAAAAAATPAEAPAPALVPAPTRLPPRPPREAIPPLPEEGVPEDLRAFELTLAGAGSPASFSMEQRSGGVVIRVGDREYAIDVLIKEAEELRRERARLRSELVRRHTLLVEREDEVDSVRKTVHELENFIHELQATVTEKERAFRDLQSSRGAADTMLAELQAVVPEKDRLLEEALERSEAAAAEIERVRERIRERERALEDLRRERDGLKERSARLDAELRSRSDELRDAEERLEVIEERSSRFEEELGAARSERDDLTARLAVAADERQPRAFLRDSRAERSATDGKLDQLEKVAEERRRTLDAVRAELVTVSHRVIDLEGQVARRDAEVARLHRERERLDEKLATALAEAAARGEAEAANRSRREESERVLRERSTALELRNEELTGLRRLHDQVRGELAAAGERLGEQGQAVESLQEQRSALRARLGEVEAERSTLATELATVKEERDRLEWSNEETRQTSARATSALEAVRAARDEIGARLAEAIALKSRAEEERERYLAEARRLEAELRRERELRSEEHAGLAGKLAARDAELEALDRRFQATLSENGLLTDGIGALTRERDEVAAQVQATAERLQAAGSQVQRLRRELDAALADRQRANELAETLSARDAMVLDLESNIQQKQAALDQLAVESAALVDRVQAQRLASEEKRRQEMIALAEGKRHEVEQIGRRHREEVAGLTALRESERAERDQQIDRLQQQLLAGEEKLAEASRLEAGLRGEVQRRDAALQSLRADLERASTERRRLAEELETKVSSKVLHVQKLEAGLARLKEEATREIGNWRTRTHDLEQRVTDLTADDAKLREVMAAQTQENERLEAQVAGARKRIAQDVRRISELVALADDQRARIGERDGQIETLQAELGRRAEDRQRLELELATRAAEVDAFRDAAADSERKLAEANESRFALSQHDRDLSQQLTEQEELIANLKADLQHLGRERDTAVAEADRDAAAAATSPALLRRIAGLERELGARAEAEALLRGEAEALLEEAANAARAIEDADDQTREMIAGLERDRIARESAKPAADLVARVRELEARLRAEALAIAERDEAYDLLDATLAARERLVTELEQRLESERARAAALAARDPGGAETRLRGELEEAARKLREAAADRDAREALRRDLDKAVAERDLLLDEVRRLRGGHPAAEAAPGSAPPAAAGSDGADLEVVVQDKQRLLEASSRYNREVTHLREAMERKSRELARIETEIRPGEIPVEARRELDAARQAAEDEVHALQASLGVSTVKMAEMNRAIVEKNRLIQQLIERHEGVRGGAADGPPAAATGIETAAETAAEAEARPADARTADRPGPLDPR